MVIHYLSFMLMFIFCGNDVGNRDITNWRFCRHDQVNNWLYNISCIFIGWDVISPNMEDNVIWFISYYRLVYYTSYLCTVKWVYVDIAVSSLTTNYVFNNAITYNKYPLTIFPFPIDWLSLHVFAVVISLDDKLFLSILLLPSCRWFVWDMSSCWTLSFVLFFV